MPRIKDLTGMTFNQLTVLGPSGQLSKSRAIKWLCRCACGKETIGDGHVIQAGKKKSCGCAVKNKTGPVRHGHARAGNMTGTYYSWSAMLARCTNPKSKKWPRYGGRGIKVCDKWLRFDGFLEDMGAKPDGHSIERVDLNGNYEKANCKWIPIHAQARNRSNNRLIEFRGETKCAVEWAQHFDISYVALRMRFHRGQDVTQALEEMIQHKEGKRGTVYQRQVCN